MGLSIARLLVTGAVALSSTGALSQSQPIDRDEFARALLRIIESSKDRFRPLRAEVSSRDDKGAPFAWKSTIAIRGTASVVVFEDFVSIRMRRGPRSLDEARAACRDAVGLVRASLPIAQWKTAKESIEPTSAGGERGTVRFERGERVDPVVYVSCRASASGAGRVAVRVSNWQRGSRRSEED